MIVCEIILIAIGCVSTSLIIGMGCAFNKVIKKFNKEITTLTKEIEKQTERIKKIQLKVLSLNEISGLNDNM